MKKSALAVFIVLCLVFGLSAQTQHAQQPPQQKPEDIQKNLVQVEKTQVVPDKMKPGFESITAKDSIAMLTYIASDLMEGRETTTRGYRLAAEYAASLLALWKLKPGGDQPSMGRMMMGLPFGPEGPRQTPPERSFLQEFAMREITDSTTVISLDLKVSGLNKTRTFHSGVDFRGTMPGSDSFTAPVVFAGYGISEKAAGYEDFKDLDVKGKIVMILTEAPGKDNPDSPFQKNKELKEKYAPVSPMMMMRRGGGFSKTQEITKLGAVAILQVQSSVKDSEMVNDLARPRPVSDERPIIHRERRRLMLPGATERMPWEGSPTLTITREMANAVLEGSGQKIEELKQKIDTTLKPASMEIPGTRLSITTTAKTALVTCRNVIGYIEGSDPNLKNEAVVIGAHLDHNGMGGEYIFNGADDNGSGSVGVLNLAHAFATNSEKPKRSVVFCLWTGEEEGLLGSRYYVQNPLYPMDKTMAYFNMDMISRPFTEQSLSRGARMLRIPVDNEAFKKVKASNLLSVSFSAEAGFADALRSADQFVGLDLYFRESGKNERGMGDSDDFSFASAQVPWLSVITSIHEDYHQTSDSVEKASGEMIEKVSRLAFLTTYALADK
jgi:Peptidase family M28